MGESVLKLPADLSTVSDSFTPDDRKQLNGRDLDFGSGGVMLLPPVAGQTAPPMAVAMGKDAVLYLLNQNNLGRSARTTPAPCSPQRLAPTGGGTWEGPPTTTVPLQAPCLRASR